MKQVIAIILIFLASISIIIWDTVYVKSVFSYMKEETQIIKEVSISVEPKNEKFKEKIEKVDEFWTKHMDNLCISIPRKDLQVIADHLQFILTAIENDDKDSLVTYSALLHHNLYGLMESNTFTLINII